MQEAVERKEHPLPAAETPGGKLRPLLTGSGAPGGRCLVGGKPEPGALEAETTRWTLLLVHLLGQVCNRPGTGPSRRNAAHSGDGRSRSGRW